MVKSFLIALILLFAIVGICEFIYFLRMIFYYPGVHSKKYVITFLEDDHAIKQINFLWQKIKWQGSDFAEGIIALTDNICTDEVDACKKFINKKKVLLCRSDTLDKCSLIIQGENFDGNRQ